MVCIRNQLVYMDGFLNLGIGQFKVFFIYIEMRKSLGMSYGNLSMQILGRGRRISKGDCEGVVCELEGNQECSEWRNEWLIMSKVLFSGEILGGRLFVIDVVCR